jgi:hypothetical protein
MAHFLQLQAEENAIDVAQGLASSLEGGTMILRAKEAAKVVDSLKVTIGDIAEIAGTPLFAREYSTNLTRVGPNWNAPDLPPRDGRRLGSGGPCQRPHQRTARWSMPASTRRTQVCPSLPPAVLALTG